MVVKIPKPILIKYWTKYAEFILPWLKNRPITLEQVFDNKIIYRRYTDSSKKELITISTKQEVITWGYRHTYSFHPYICSPYQKAQCWYVLDIDPNENVKFSETKSFTFWVANYLQTKGFNIKIAFGGKNGFHIFITLNIKKQEAVFEFSKNLSLDIARQAWKHKEFPNIAVLLTSKEEQKVLETSISKFDFTGFKKVINLDTRILHRFANIRAPYSIHPETGLVSLPVDTSDILHFDLKSTEVKNLL